MKEVYWYSVGEGESYRWRHQRSFGVSLSSSEIKDWKILTFAKAHIASPVRSTPQFKYMSFIFSNNWLTRLYILRTCYTTIIHEDLLSTVGLHYVTVITEIDKYLSAWKLKALIKKYYLRRTDLSLHKINTCSRP